MKIILFIVAVSIFMFSSFGVTKVSYVDIKKQAIEKLAESITDAIADIENKQKVADGDIKGEPVEVIEEVKTNKYSW